MLNHFSSADEARHHAALRAFVGQRGTVLSYTQNEQSAFALVKLEAVNKLVQIYGPFKPRIGQAVRLSLGHQFTTDDQRVIYNLIGYLEDA